MPKPKMSQPATGVRDNLSDERLLDLDLTTNDPNSLENLVRELPTNHREAHIEFEYDLRNQGIAEADYFTCIHGHHHLHGAVMRAGDVRFLVGWVCAEEIYGQRVTKMRNDFLSLQTRQALLRRIRDLQGAMADMAKWASDVMQSSVIADFDYVRDSLRWRIPWVFLTLRDNRGRKIFETPMPGMLCADEVHAESSFIELMNDITSIITSLSGEPTKVAERIGPLRGQIGAIIRRSETFIRRMSEVELFFQPSTMMALCQLAKVQSERPKKMTPGLMSLATRDFILRIPPNFSVPDRTALDRLIVVAAG